MYTSEFKYIKGDIYMYISDVKYSNIYRGTYICIYLTSNTEYRGILKCNHSTSNMYRGIYICIHLTSNIE